MLGAKKFENVNSSNGSAQLSCEHPLSELRGLEHLKVSRCYARGFVLFVEGQDPSDLYVLREGRVKISIASQEGKTLVIRIAQPGDLLGINALFSDQPYAASAETLERCCIDFVPREVLLDLLERDTRMYASVAQALSRKFSSIVEQTRLIFLSKSSSEKLARLLVKWCDEHGKRTAQGVQLNSCLTHEEMAQMICSSRETVTRVLSEFKRKRIVSLIDNTIFVRNRKALEALARC
jgi:CRP/FNR family transcriptional regulator, cyclic AMP receptor protein